MAGPILSAADILLVGNPGAEETASLVEFLTTEGHNVTEELRRDGPENTNNFDLVIISRSTNSSGYNGPGEAAAWNAVTAPMINFNVFFYTQSAWGWDSDPVWGVGGTGEFWDTPYPDPDHPFLSGLEAPTGIIFSAERSARRPKIEHLLPTGSTIVATADDASTLGIFTIDEGTLLSSPDGMTAAGNIRIAWPMANLNDWDVINSNGEQILRNIITTVAPNPFKITSTSVEPETGDLLIKFSLGSANYILKSSQDLTGPFKEVTSAELENDNTTFRIPAADLNPGHDFFIIEITP